MKTTSRLQRAPALAHRGRSLSGSIISKLVSRADASDRASRRGAVDKQESSELIVG